MPPAPPSIYSFYRCYMQRGGYKYVRLYSEHYRLLPSAIEGTCEYDDATDQYLCGPVGCRTCEGTDDAVGYFSAG
jgi:hypothetical protein